MQICPIAFLFADASYPYNSEGSTQRFCSKVLALNCTPFSQKPVITKSCLGAGCNYHDYNELDRESAHVCSFLAL